MENFLKKYLSIGEVSKIKNISIKSLRYYDQLGILPPSYINPQTGYRYYSIEQLLIIDFIKVCLDLDIPLKQFKSYIEEDGSVNIGRLIKDAQVIVLEKEKQLHDNMAFLNTMSKHVNRAAKIKKYPDTFVQTIPARYFLTTEWKGKFQDYREISGCYTRLFRQCQELDVTDTFNQGLFYFKKNSRIISRVFLEIPPIEEKPDNLILVKAGDYNCRVLKEDHEIKEATENIRDILIIKELFDLRVNTNDPLVEIQYPVSGEAD